MSKVSVILPAARDKMRAEEIIKLIRWNLCVLDIVLASPTFEIEGVTNFKDENVGSARVLSEAIAKTDPCTDYICWLSDICLPHLGAIDVLYAYTSANPSFPFIGEFRTWPYLRLGHYRVCTIRGKQYARWGMLSRKSIAAIGGFFDPAFCAYYGDVDLSLRCWRAGGSVATCPDSCIEIRGHHHVNTAPNSDDESTFLARWSEDYPGIRRDNTAEWNVDREIPC